LLNMALALPSPAALSALRAMNVQTLILHIDLMARTPWIHLQGELAKVRSVSIVARDGPIIVYSLSRVPASSTAL
jgi:hypothetical protein